MFSELPKLLDRNFAIGYFLPVALFVMPLCYLFSDHLWALKLVNSLSQNPIMGVTASAIAIWAASITLMPLNRTLIRFLEGYYWPIRGCFLERFKRSEWERLSSEIDELNKKAFEKMRSGVEVEIKLERRYSELILKKVTKFPNQSHLILSTSFGNAIRAFEVYPYLMYGIDSIPGWTRLVAVIPKDFRNYIDNEKAILDLFVNLFYLSIVFFIISILHLIYSFSWSDLLWPVFTFCVIVISYQGAYISAIGWGEYIKAAFDLYLNDLAEKMKVELPSSWTGRRLLWEHVSQSMIYHIPFDDSEVGGVLQVCGSVKRRAEGLAGDGSIEAGPTGDPDRQLAVEPRSDPGRGARHRRVGRERPEAKDQAVQKRLSGSFGTENDDVVNMKKTASWFLKRT